MFQIGGKYYHEDIESGQIVQVSKRTFEAHSLFMQKFYDQLNSLRSKKGTIIIFSTPADTDNGDDFKNLWNQQNNL